MTSDISWKSRTFKMGDEKVVDYLDESSIFGAEPEMGKKN